MSGGTPPDMYRNRSAFWKLSANAHPRREVLHMQSILDKKPALDIMEPYNRVNYDWTNSFQRHFPEAPGQSCHRHWRCHGFGKAIVNKLVAEGGKVLVFDIGESSPKEIGNGDATNIAYFRGEVASLTDWSEALARVLLSYNHLDIVVNNAGVLHKAQPSIDLSDEEWEQVFRVNVKQIHLSTKTIIPYFKEAARPGLFVNISSMSGARPRPNLVASASLWMSPMQLHTWPVTSRLI
ncbi:hypothetical protein SI65_06458 [Aspergillus cristatus]|uniref:Uncharacterized protein n=1 Tax=Aspergillus cristatus TaxID=573508 RepID=A0A1E3B9M2_ASPCR|nr:hypothetical protein SI65_06458 [Aspergillus cristatus]